MISGNYYYSVTTVSASSRSNEYRLPFCSSLRIKVKYFAFRKIVHIPETLYTVQPTDLRLSGEKQFDYVDPANREVQLEMEAVCTAHLQAIGAWLAPEFQRIDFGQENFAREASVIIPVRNQQTYHCRSCRIGLAATN